MLCHTPFSKQSVALPFCFKSFITHIQNQLFLVLREQLIFMLFWQKEVGWLE